MPSARPGHHQRRQAAEASEEAKAERGRAMVADYRATFGTISGQRVLADLLRRCCVLYPSPDPHTEGSRAVGLHLIEMITRDDASMLQFTVSANTEDLFHE